MVRVIGGDQPMSRFERSHGMPVPSLGKLVLLAGICAAGVWGWTEYRQRQTRWQLWNAEATFAERRQAIEIWAAEGVAGATELIGGLTAKDFRTRRDAAIALGRIGAAAKAAVPELKRAGNDAHIQVREAAIAALAQIVPDDPETIELMIVLATDENTEICKAAANALAVIGEPALPHLLPLLADSRAAMRLKLIDLAHHIAPDSEEVIAALRLLTEDSDPSVREHAIVLLINDRRASLAEVLSWMHEKNPLIVSQSIGALSQFGAESVKALPDLIQCLERPDLLNANPSHNVIGQTLNWLMTFGSAGNPAVSTLLKLRESQPDSYQRQMILETLVAVGADRDPLIAMLVADLGNQDLSSTAGRLLVRVDEEEARRQVPLLIERLNGTNDEEIGSAISAVHGMGSTAVTAVPALASLLSRGTVSMALSASMTLGWFGPKAVEAVPAIVAQLERPDVSGELAENLMHTLSRIGPAAASSTPRLLQIVADSRRPQSTRFAAMEALKRIGVRTPNVVAPLRTALRDESPRILDAVLHWLTALKVDDESILREVLDCLENSSAEVRCSAALLLAENFGSRKEVVSGLSGLLSDEMPPVRLVAARTLGRLGPPASAALPALRSALADKENALTKYGAQTISEAIAEAIRQIEPSAKTR